MNSVDVLEPRLQHHVAHQSLQHLHAQLKAFQLKSQRLEYDYFQAKEEASLNAGALKQNVGKYESLKAKFDRVLKVCERFRNDRDELAEAAEDAEERRADADRRAAKAEQRFVLAEQSERAALRLVEDMLRASPTGKAHTLPLAEAKGSPDWNSVTECADKSSSLRKNQSNVAQNASEEDQGYQSPTDRLKISTTKQPGAAHNAIARSPTSELPSVARGTKRALFEIHEAHEKNISLPRQKTGDDLLVERSKPMDENCKVGRIHILGTHEMQNFNFMEANAGVSLEQAAQSNNPVAKYLFNLVMIAKDNLLKAENEGDIIHVKYCELHRLLMDTLVTFGILPELGEQR